MEDLLTILDSLEANIQDLAELTGIELQ